MKSEFTMSVSPICVKDGQKYAYVSFSDGERKAEGKIPECKILSAEGLDRGEVKLLEEYMKQELPQLKKMAAGIRLMDAIMK